MKYKVIKQYTPSENTTYCEGAMFNEDDLAYQFLKENNLVGKYLKEIKPELTYKPFTPDHIEDYYYVSDGGGIVETINSSSNADKFRINSGNAFRTKEEAEHHRDWLIARKRIMDSSDFVPDWGDINEAKWTIRYNYPYRILAAMPYNTSTSGEPIYYETRDQAEQAIKDLENEYLVYYGVKRKLED